MILPGFLGTVQEWEGIFQTTWPVFDFWSAFSSAPISAGLEKLGAWVNGQKKRQGVLIAYSFGARLALHALLQEDWAAAVLISAHTGLKTQLEKENRLRLDKHWAQRFVNEDWESVMKAWNAQAVFQLSSKARSFEFDYSRQRLAEGLSICSLGQQKDLSQDLKKIKTPVLWICGEHDMKFQKIQKEAVSLNPGFRGHVLAGAGHRAHLDRPLELKRLVKEFLESEGFYDSTCIG